VKTAVAKLQQERQRFWAQTDAKCLSMAELIDRFLEFTDTCVPDGCVLDLTIAEKRLVECQQRLRR